MTRGLYPQRLTHGWNYRDSDSQNGESDDYSEESNP